MGSVEHCIVPAHATKSKKSSDGRLGTRDKTPLFAKLLSTCLGLRF